MPDEYDVVIIGGGLVGASVACALAPLGLRIAVAEARAAPAAADGDRRLALAWGSRQIFIGMGLWPQLAPHVTPIHRIHVSQQGRFGVTRLDRRHRDVDALGYVVDSSALGRVLGERLAREPAVTIYSASALDSLAADASGAQVTLRRDGATEALRARLVAAADGARSAVREALRIGVRRWEYGQSAILATVTPQRPHGHTAYERFTDQGPLALLPVADGRCALVWTRRDERVPELLALDEGRFLGQVQRCFGTRLGRFVAVEGRSAHPLALTLALEAVRPRVALVGNAAHTLHPVAGQGFNLGLRDVAVLAELVAQAVADGTDIGEGVVLEGYARWRRRDQVRVVLFTDGLARIFANPLAPVAMARSAGLVALDVCPPAKRVLMRQTMGLAGRLPRLARGLPLVL